MSISATVMAKRLHLDVKPIQIPGSHIWACQIYLTAKLAEDWLAKFNGKNRTVRQRKVDAISTDIVDGNWIETHQGIAFDSDGDMTSGQHRCHAVLKSGIDIPVIVFLNCLPTERKAIDQTSGRTVQDVSTLGHDNAVSAFEASVARAMLQGMVDNATTRLPPQAMYDFVDIHRESLQQVISSLPRKVPGLTSACVLGAICRASYHIGKPRLKHFIEVLVNGLATWPEDVHVIVLRNFLLENKERLRDWQGRMLSYKYTVTALMNFESQKPVGTKLVPAAQEVYTLPNLK